MLTKRWKMQASKEDYAMDTEEKMQIKLQNKTIEILARIITWGDSKKACEYRNNEQLVEFFNQFGLGDIYHKGLPAPLEYTKEKLKLMNGSDCMVDVIQEAVNPMYYNENSTDSNEAAVALNEYLIKDGYKLAEDYRPCAGADMDALMDLSVCAPELEPKDFPSGFYDRYYRVDSLRKEAIDIESEVSLSHDFITEQIQKSKEKLEQKDYDGAITNARSLVESFQEELIKKAGSEVPKYDGDIGKLYKATKKVLNLDPSQKDLSENLKQVLSSLNGLVMGIGGLSNKMGDRHARTYKPERHHAKLAVNSALMFCEFLLDSYEYQQGKKTP